MGSGPRKCPVNGDQFDKLWTWPEPIPGLMTIHRPREHSWL